MAYSRCGIASSVGLCLSVLLSGCSAPTTETAEVPQAAATPAVVVPAARQAQYDVSRIAALAGDFPSDFVVGPTSGPTKLGDDLLPAVGTVVSQGKPFTVDPPECLPLLKQVEGVIGSDSMHVRADAPERQLISVDAVSPVSVSAEIPPSGCSQMTYSVEQDKYPLTGTVQQLTAPTIDGATTIALKFDADRLPGQEYSYTAIVDGHTFIGVQARGSSSYVAQEELSDLLVKAVAAVRGG